MARITVPNDLDAHWMPFTANRQFKAAPRLLVGAKDMYYTSHDGRQVLDGCAGLWCVNAGHGRDKISEAVARQISEMDYSPSFQMGHPLSFELASRLVELAPDGIDHVFYCNSGSEAVDTALKMALAYHRIRGEGSRTRLIGRERGYHGVGFGGISVGGIVSNRKHFGTLLSGVDHLRHTHDPARNAFSWGQPEHGAELADDLERLVALHDASTIAAVIVEPIAGSTGVLIPPKGYLKRLREICDRHGILLIFDEVICGFGRTGKAFGADSFEVTPDLMTTAKGITNGAVPMGAVFAKKEIYDTFMTGPEHLIEFFHGYTYSGHPLACAAALATLDIYAEEKLFDRAANLSEYFGKAAHALRDLPNVIDIRNYGMVAAVELSPRAGEPTKRAYEIFVRAYEQGVLLRFTGDIIAISPPLIIDEAQIDHLYAVLAEAIKATA
ncbi:MAG: aspartate aminotransferase family protein [Tistrella sp.]|jgi:beta-alanine--pyruvate transaminase|uniref:Omega-amino acid--pyruvate aminotransferase n=2 Tax=Tistrella mobilis TaxID=171437 RepID=I3TJ46_TISMK|nr:aspartate aminotransferase family protein [Tistrella mobilis]MAM75175.1 aspartate aminotransferase family protein [Tistrella sp.]AFK52784.1 omega-amino acid--pyruvate aminotransferase [Tistrella mobilis KA081020-065]KYO49785.1 omega amino acid--pyruvate aminotransferase [Tistrella mobilis]MBA79014.1 aspartate aminotransferase family protein [Tistrella sp.]HAE47317.1 aspartate aminotransferase family protein [Tistrella mobilis]